jgi:hypothetical protein
VVWSEKWRWIKANLIDLDERCPFTEYPRARGSCAVLPELKEEVLFELQRMEHSPKKGAWRLLEVNP